MSSFSSRKPGEGKASGGQTRFPMKLHYILSEFEKNGQCDVLTWLPHGRAFIVVNQKRLVEEILPNWFEQSKFPSFQRQLNIYGFRRISSGPDKGGYYHDLFLRGMSQMATRIPRTSGGKAGRRPGCPQLDPDFYAMEPVPVSTRGPAAMASLQRPGQAHAAVSMASTGGDRGGIHPSLLLASLPNSAPSSQGLMNAIHTVQFWNTNLASRVVQDASLTLDQVLALERLQSMDQSSRALMNARLEALRVSAEEEEARRAMLSRLLPLTAAPSNLAWLGQNYSSSRPTTAGSPKTAEEQEAQEHAEKMAALTLPRNRAPSLSHHQGPPVALAHVAALQNLPISLLQSLIREGLTPAAAPPDAAPRSSFTMGSSIDRQGP